ncbi:GAF domain-containing protein [Nocardioides sp.]|uniref:GAF domain-containing protein n=1 Tax=Nocardioides sp. TaxID=35761 RepID=UPI0025F1F3A0|nr:GAF domain-containing protein [Nocardioides sp.]
MSGVDHGVEIVDAATALPRPRAARLGELLAEVGTVADLAHEVRTHARRAAGADGATFVVRENDQCFYVDEDGIAPLWKGQRFPIASCISGWAMLHGEPVVIPDITVDERIPQSAYRPTFVRSLLMMPVGGDRPVAAIGAYWASEHRATSKELAAVSEVAASAAECLRRIGLEGAPWAPNLTGR